MNHTHRVHVSGGHFIVSCAFARDIERAMSMGWPRLVEGQRHTPRQRGSLVIATKAIIAIEKELDDGAEAEDSCSHNR